MVAIPKRALLICGTFLLAVLLYVDRICISTARDPVTTDLGLSDKQFGWIMAAFALGYALFQTPSGWMADRFGPRRVLSGVVAIWSLFTGLSGAAWNYLSLLVVRFLFGAGEAGAYPGMARAVYAWMPMKERGIATGLNFSGSRLGAAFALPVVSWLIASLGWRLTFVVLMAVGFVWAVFWYVWFRDDPSQHPRIRKEEMDFILANRQQASVTSSAPPPLTLQALFQSRNLWRAMVQYFCSNFTFFFSLTWLYPHIKETYDLGSVEAGWYTAAPLVAGALGNVFSGWLMDQIYRSGRWRLSRQVPAVAGFGLAAIGLVVSLFMDTPLGSIFWLSIAIFGADMTLSPSWAFCTDIGRSNAGAVSGTMNMAGNIGSFVTSLAFPYLLEWTESVNTFFYVGAALNVLAIWIWFGVRPERPLEEY